MTNEQDAAEGEPRYVLEAGVPLPESMVWLLQRNYYGEQGIAAWSRVPQSITTSPVIARAYARLALGFLRDMRSELDASQPVYIVELGAGSGRFAYRFLKAFSSLLRDGGMAAQPFVYVMTDATPSVIDFWRNNSRLNAYVTTGQLDFAEFDVLHPGPLSLINTATTLRPGELANPVILLGNYIFDSVPQDALTVKAGAMYRSLVTIRASDPNLDLAAAGSTVRISIGFTNSDVPIDLDAEPDPVLRQILRQYAQRLDDTTVVVPRAAFACARFFKALGRGRALCLVGDIGDAREEELAGRGPPGFGAGGGLWMAVNFHAIGEYARELGGRARHPRARHLTLNISMVLFGPPDQSFVETELAYGDAIDHHGPDDLWMLTRALADQPANVKFEAALALLRTTGWDSDFVVRCQSALLEGLPNANQPLRQDVLRGLELAWDQFYPIGEHTDVPFALGALLYALGQYPKALEFFERSLTDFGEDPRTTVNIAMTLYRLKRLPETLQWLDRTLALDPTNDLASRMRPDVEADLGASAQAQPLRPPAPGPG